MSARSGKTYPSRPVMRRSTIVATAPAWSGAAFAWALDVRARAQHNSIMRAKSMQLRRLGFANIVSLCNTSTITSWNVQVAEQGEQCNNPFCILDCRITVLAESDQMGALRSDARRSAVSNCYADPFAHAQGRGLHSNCRTFSYRCGRRRTLFAGRRRCSSTMQSCPFHV